MAKRGRKKKAGERYPGGKLMPAMDRGTAEYQSRRAWAAGKGDQALTWHVLGILRAHDQISEQQYQAACEYRRAFCLLYRKPDVPAVPMDGVAKGVGIEPPEKALKNAKTTMGRFDAALATLVEKHGRVARDAWCNLVVYDRAPRWMMPVFQRPSDAKESRLFKLSIEAIERAHTMRAAA